MKLLLTLFTVFFAFNATALSFTERMSAQNKPEVAQSNSSLTAEDKALSDGKEPQIQDYSQLVQALLIIIAFMATVIYLQNKKIQKLIAAAEEE
jgi:ABC-type uncharacterized transport system YnjBCD permease subunit